MSNISEPRNQLPAYDKEFLLSWLSQPTNPAQGEVELVRDLALATRVLGTETQTLDTEEHICRRWELLTRAGDKLELTFNSTYAGAYPVRAGIAADYELRFIPAQDPDLSLFAEREARVFEFGSQTPTQAYGSISPTIRQPAYVEAVRNDLLKAPQVHDTVSKYRSAGLA